MMYSRVSVRCGFCGREIEIKKYLLTKVDHHFCDAKCYGRWQRQRHRKPRVQKHCQQCGKPMMLSPGQARHRRFCSHPCSSAWRKAHGVLAGDKNPLWRGGHSEYRGANWKQQRAAAQRRDGHKCVDCSSRTRLLVHHIVPFRLFDSYTVANVLSNLVTLCDRCHGKREMAVKVMGYKTGTTQRKKHCASCGREFAPTTSRDNHCPKCYTKKCLTCGKVFVSRRYDRRVQFCSTRCAGDYKKGRPRGGRN